MSPTKESLVQAVGTLTDEQARRTIEFIHGIRRPHDRDRLEAVLGNDPTFELPATRARPSKPAVPVEGKGIPLSRLIVNDRR